MKFESLSWTKEITWQCGKKNLMCYVCRDESRPYVDVYMFTFGFEFYQTWVAT